MAKVSLQQIGKKLREVRGDRGIREVAKEVGVSPATLSRVERGNLPDLDTFAKLCRWMRLDPAHVLGMDLPRADSELVITAHLRADRTMSLRLAQALARTLLAAQKRLELEEATGPS